jgi:MoaA/NifB/PqqE/SkfB family radical SAM enzyme
MCFLRDKMTSLQIETTTRCTLKCPACSRTVFSQATGRPMPHHDVDADLVYKFLDCSAGKSIDELSLCGDAGDSIYYPNLFYFIERFKPDKKIVIVTNGSYRDQQFWTELCARLDSTDTVVFSIDGLEHTNHLYRVNSDWNSIMLGLDTVVAAGIKVLWSTNIFSFNHDRLEEMQAFAESRGAEFKAKITGRFGRDDLRPPDHMVNHHEVYRPEYSDANQPIHIVPDCKNNLFRNTICAENYFWPCGYIRGPLSFYKSQLWKQRSQWSIQDRTLDDMLESSLSTWVQSIEQDPGNADMICKMKCKANQPQEIVYKV